MCDIQSATVSCCELSVCMLCAAVSCLCAVVYCSHHCCRAAVVTVFIPIRASSAPKTPFTRTHEGESYPCVCLRYAPVCLHHTPCVIQREKGLGQLAVLVSTGSVERETRKGCVVHC